MSISVEQGVESLRPAYNDAVYILSSSNVAQDNFKFVVDYYVAGVKVDRQLIPPHPTYGTGYVNVAPLLESRLTSNIALSDDRILENTSSNLAYVMKFGEAYGSTGTIVYPDLHVTGTKYLWNGILDYEDSCVYSSGDYICNASTPCNFLTNKPSSGDIMVDDNAWLYWIDFASIVVYAYVITRDSTGATINSFKIRNNLSSKIFDRMPTGCTNINTIPLPQFITGTPPIILGNEHSYSVQLFDAGNNALTEKYYYTLAENCSRYEKRRLQFLNKLGGYDFFDFTMVSKENSDIERSNYKKNLGTYASANSFSFSPNDRANSQFHTRIKDKVNIQTDFIHEDIYAWLEELITSPDVRLDTGTYLIPINITNTSFEKKKEVNEKLFNLQLEYTLSYDRYRQRL